MAKDDTQAPAADNAVAAPATVAVAPETVAAPEELSLDDFCVRLSETVKSPEAIGGFNFTERAANRLRGTFEAYRARFDEFLNKPV